MRYHNRTGLHEKGSLNVQAYVDVKKIATIASFLDKTGELYAPQYGIISQYAINYLMAILEEHYPQHLERFETTSDAIHWLDEHRFSMAQFKPEGNRRISRELARESESREEFGSAEYGLKPMLKSGLMTAQAEKPIKELPLFEREALAKELYKQHGIIGEGYAYLFDSSIENPNLTPEQKADRKQAIEGVANQMEEMMAQQEERFAPPSKDQLEINLRAAAITLMLKNATSSQQMPIPAPLTKFLTDISVVEEVALLTQPFIEQRERDMMAKEEEDKKKKEEQDRRLRGV